MPSLALSIPISEALLQCQNRRAERGVGRGVVCELPVASPWRNNIEPCWTHAKKAIMEVDRKWTAVEITHRVCAHCRGVLLPYLKIDVAGAGALDRSVPWPLERNG
jgi:hypothetical protein